MRNYHLKINYWRLLLSCVIIVIMGVISYGIFFAYDESGTGKELIFHISEWVLNLILYPAYFLPENWLRENLWPVISCAMTGILLDGLLIELLLIKYQAYRLKKSAQIRNLKS